LQALIPDQRTAALCMPEQFDLSPYLEGLTEARLTERLAQALQNLLDTESDSEVYREHAGNLMALADDAAEHGDFALLSHIYKMFLAHEGSRARSIGVVARGCIDRFRGSKFISVVLKKLFQDRIQLDETQAEMLLALGPDIAPLVRIKKINIKGVDDIISAFIKGFAFGVNPIRLLFQIRNVDEYTYTHMVNVCILTMSQAESLGFEGRHLYQIGVAAILHDAGKLLIPQDILNKPGKLTPNERSVIETHSAKGASFILSQKSVTKLAVVGALEHHIRYDGTGYPVISSGYKTNIVSQLISISDVFDAMRSRRPYKEPKPIDAILHILKEKKGATFNPILVDNFIRLLATKPH
jgi:HD-GYP domain-containing protein (c-di-GMP phosphodiesterase class II)